MTNFCRALTIWTCILQWKLCRDKCENHLITMTAKGSIVEQCSKHDDQYYTLIFTFIFQLLQLVYFTIAIIGDVLTLLKGKDSWLIKLRDILFASLAFPICVVSSCSRSWGSQRGKVLSFKRSNPNKQLTTGFHMIHKMPIIEMSVTQAYMSLTFDNVIENIYI